MTVQVGVRVANGTRTARYSPPAPATAACQRLRLRLLVVVCVPVIRQLRQQLLRQDRIAQYLLKCNSTFKGGPMEALHLLSYDVTPDVAEPLRRKQDGHTVK